MPPATIIKFKKKSIYFITKKNFLAGKIKSAYNYNNKVTLVNPNNPAN